MAQASSPRYIYVSEVTWTFAVIRGLAPESCHTFQKCTLES